MSDVTDEEIAAEMERAHALTSSEDLCDWREGGEEDHSTPCVRIAKDRATVRKEARREALKEAEDVAWDIAGDEGESNEDDVSLGAEKVAVAISAIRALMGPT